MQQNHHYYYDEDRDEDDDDDDDDDLHCIVHVGVNKDSDGSPIGTLWDSLQDSYGLRMGSYGIYRIPRGFLLESCGMPIGFQWNPMEFVWESYGIPVGL